MEFLKYSSGTALQKYYALDRPELSLIPSENILSGTAREVMALSIANRYHLPTDYIHSPAMPSRKELQHFLLGVHEKVNSLYGVPWSDVRFLSGMHMMMGILCCFRQQYQNLLSLGRLLGGHSSTEYLASSLGYKTGFIPGQRGVIDIDALRKYLEDSPRTLVYLDHSVTLGLFDYHALLSALKEQDLLFYDISHLNVFWIYEHTVVEDPRFFFGGSFHKTFPGPQKAMVASFVQSPVTRKLQEYIEYAVSSPHINEMLSLDVVLADFPDFGHEYYRQMKANANVFAARLNNYFPVATVNERIFTNSHQIWMQCRDHEALTARCAEAAISVYRSFLPSFHEYGMRFGIQELTMLGMEEPEMVDCAEAIRLAYNGRAGEAEEVVSRLMNRFLPEYAYCH